MKAALFVLAVLIGAGLLYIRLAPSDPARWHTDPAEPSLAPGPGRFLVCAGGDLPPLPADEATLARLDAIARSWPRTGRLAGSPEEGRITWITRTRLFGFPDYTTAGITADGMLCIHARARFGYGDQGVNEARIRVWLDSLAR